ncbi:unnamed protein product, partial [Prorocentrum cordatum]
MLPVLIWVSYRVDIGSFGDWRVFRAATGDPEPEGPPPVVTRRSSTGSNGSQGSDTNGRVSPASGGARSLAFRRHSCESIGIARTTSQGTSVNWRKSHTLAKHRLLATITGGGGGDLVSSGRLTRRQSGFSSSMMSGRSTLTTQSFESSGSLLGKKAPSTLLEGREDEPVAWVQFKANYQYMSE